MVTEAAQIGRQGGNAVAVRVARGVGGILLVEAVRVLPPVGEAVAVGVRRRAVEAEVEAVRGGAEDLLGGEGGRGGAEEHRALAADGDGGVDVDLGCRRQRHAAGGGRQAERNGGVRHLQSIGVEAIPKGEEPGAQRDGGAVVALDRPGEFTLGDEEGLRRARAEHLAVEDGRRLADGLRPRGQRREDEPRGRGDPQAG